MVSSVSRGDRPFLFVWENEKKTFLLENKNERREENAKQFSWQFFYTHTHMAPLTASLVHKVPEKKRVNCVHTRQHFNNLLLRYLL